MNSKSSLINTILTVLGIIVLGVALEWVSLQIYPHSLVNVPVAIKYEFGFLTFTRIVYYKNGIVLESPPQLDYLQIFTVIAVIYLLIKLLSRR